MGTGGAGSRCRWNTIEKREEGILQVTTSWAEQVRELKWPEVNGRKKIDPRAWALGSSIEEWRTMDLQCSHSIRQRCIVDLRAIKKATPGRKRSDIRAGVSESLARMEAERKKGKQRRAFESIQGTGQQTSAMEDIGYRHPVTKEMGWYPKDPQELHSVLQDHFAAEFATPPHSRKIPIRNHRSRGRLYRAGLPSKPTAPTTTSQIKRKRRFLNSSGKPCALSKLGRMWRWSSWPWTTNVLRLQNLNNA